MISSTFSSLVQGADTASLGAQRPAAHAAPNQANQNFWRDVFDHAKGVGVHEQTLRESHHRDQSGPERQKVTPIGAQRDAIASLGERSTWTGQQMLTGAALQQTEFAGLDVKFSPTLPDGNRYPLSIRTPGLVADEADASVVARPEQADNVRQGQACTSGSPEADNALRAHVCQTAAGDWKVTLRANKGLSVAQALAAAAQATQHSAGAAPGQIKQVVFNGLSIYQQADHAEAESSASSSFELR
jgi:hypothetical protein